MGFLDKVFGTKTAGEASPGESEGFRKHEVREKGFGIAVPQDWSAAEGPFGFEAHPQECSQVKDPGSGQEIASPRVTVTVVEIQDPRQNMIPETLRSRSAELPGHRLVKHIAGSVKNADHGVVYEFIYGPGDAPIQVIGILAQKKDRLFIVSGCGTKSDFEKNRAILESSAMSFKLL